MTTEGPSRGVVPRRVVRAALVLAVLVLVVDQATKALIVNVVMDPPRIIEVTSFFNLVLTYNRGVTFGLLDTGSPWQPWVFSLLALAVVVGLLVWLPRVASRVHAFAIGLIVGGAVGNVIDRLTTVGVIDFLDFHLAGFHWYAFNVADSAIVVGVALFVWEGLFSTSGERRTNSGQERRRQS